MGMSASDELRSFFSLSRTVGFDPQQNSQNQTFAGGCAKRAAGDQTSGDFFAL
jgi:hypothetical protein